LQVLLGATPALRACAATSSAGPCCVGHLARGSTARSTAARDSDGLTARQTRRSACISYRPRKTPRYQCCGSCVDVLSAERSPSHMHGTRRVSWPTSAARLSRCSSWGLLRVTTCKENQPVVPPQQLLRLVLARRVFGLHPSHMRPVTCPEDLAQGGGCRVTTASTCRTMSHAHVSCTCKHALCSLVRVSTRVPCLMIVCP